MMRRFLVVAAAVVAGSVPLAPPAAADGGDLNGYWQYTASFDTYEECDDAGRPWVPGQADGWACTHWTPSGPTADWNLYLVFGS